MTEHVFENIWTFPITLPDNPLKWLNCYVIKAESTRERSLLIDTGFNLPACRETLFAGMEELGLSPDCTDVFLTHCHSDHSGNAKALENRGFHIFISETDYSFFRSGAWGRLGSQCLREGMPQDICEEVFARNPAINYASAPFAAQFVSDGDVLRYGGHALECIHTPGHTAGHLCLYSRTHKVLFSGDHVLFDITPNICSRSTAGADALGEYLRSLDRVASYDTALALPAHRTQGNISCSQRIEELKSHHRLRLAEAEAIVRGAPGLTAYEIAGRMRWKIRAAGWNSFPAAQKWFAFSEALAHLDHLVCSGRLMKQDGRFFA